MKEKNPMKEQIAQYRIVTEKTSSLDPESSPIVERLLNNADLVLSDLDLTLTDFISGHEAGQKAIADFLGADIADQVNRMFYLTLEGHRRLGSESWDQREAYHQLVGEMVPLQHGSFGTYGLKAFSRETHMAIAGNRLNRKLTKKDIEKARDAYWDEVTKKSFVYADADIFINTVRAKNIPLVLMSASDAIMEVQEESNGISLIYNPQISEEYKQKRFRALPFSYKRAFVGDPIDKPDPLFFDKVFQSVQDELRYQSDPKKILVVGDSARNDLEAPHSRGCTTLLIKRN